MKVSRILSTFLRERERGLGLNLQILLNILALWNFKFVNLESEATFYFLNVYSAFFFFFKSMNS